jgi:Na+/H+-dicarboxylate symporter
MNNELIAAHAEASPDVFEASLHAEEDAERTLMRSIIKSVIIAWPIAIVVFVGMLGIAIGDHTEWYVWVLLGSLMGTLAALLFGVLGAVTVAAPKLDEIDRQNHAQVAAPEAIAEATPTE